MANGHIGAPYVIATASNGFPSLLPNPLHDINSFFGNGGVAVKIALFCQNSGRCWQQRLVLSQQSLLELFPVKGSTGIAATAVPMPFSPLGSVVIMKHL